MESRKVSQFSNSPISEEEPVEDMPALMPDHVKDQPSGTEIQYAWRTWPEFYSEKVQRAIDRERIVQLKHELYNMKRRRMAGVCIRTAVQASAAQQVVRRNHQQTTPIDLHDYRPPPR